MRDPKRIDRIVEKLRAYWTARPDLRLGQIVVNLSGRADPFYVEDDQAEAKMDEDGRRASTYREPAAVGVDVVAPADVRPDEPRRYYHRNDIGEVRDAASMDCLDGPAHLQPLELKPGAVESDWFAVVPKRGAASAADEALAVVAGEVAWRLATGCSTPMEAAVLIHSLRGGGA